MICATQTRIFPLIRTEPHTCNSTPTEEDSGWNSFLNQNFRGANSPLQLSPTEHLSKEYRFPQLPVVFSIWHHNFVFPDRDSHLTTDNKWYHWPKGRWSYFLPHKKKGNTTFLFLCDRIAHTSLPNVRVRIRKLYDYNKLVEKLVSRCHIN